MKADTLVSSSYLHQCLFYVPSSQSSEDCHIAEDMNEHLQAECLTTRATTTLNNAKPGGALTFPPQPMCEKYSL